jgi:hypothetical protein
MCRELKTNRHTKYHIKSDPRSSHLACTCYSSTPPALHSSYHLTNAFSQKWAPCDTPTLSLLRSHKNQSQISPMNIGVQIVNPPVRSSHGCYEGELGLLIVKLRRILSPHAELSRLSNMPRALTELPCREWLGPGLGERRPGDSGRAPAPAP